MKIILKGQNFLVLGRAGMDIYPCHRGKISDGGMMEPAFGGSSGNIAAGIARLGGNVDILSCISDDPIGHFVKNECGNYGIGTKHLHMAPKGSSTSLAFAENRLEDFQVALYRNNAADLHLSIDHIEAVDFSAYDALIVTGTALSSEPSKSATLEAMRRASFSILDIDYRIAAWDNQAAAQKAFQEASQIADMVVGNDVEFDVLGEGEAAAQDLGKNKTAIYKMGEKGAVTYHQGQRFTTPIFQVEALKPVGAGDAFMAGLVMALGAGNGLDVAVKHGAANAAIVVSRPACAPAMARKDELINFLSERG